MFLCNKTDTTEEAEHYDSQRTDLGSTKRQSRSDATSQALSKQETVFAELKKLNLLPEEDNLGSCQVYHGVSAKNIRSARINKMENDFTENFARFQRCFQMVLANSIKRQIKLAIEGMLSVQEQFILAIGDLSASSQNLSKFLSVASETEKEVMRVLLEKVSGNLVSKETINELLHRIKEETVEEAKCYRKSEGGTDPGVQAALSQFKGKSRAEVEGALSFISDMTCTISHKVATTILRTFGRSLEATISASSEDLQRAIEQITLPSLRRALARAYGIDLNRSKEKVSDAVEISRKCLFTPTEMLREIRLAVLICLGVEAGHVFVREFGTERFLSSLSTTRRPLSNMKWKENVVHAIICKFNPERIARAINETCKKKVFGMHTSFVGAIKSLQSFYKVLQLQADREQTLKELRVLYVPCLMQLAVKAFALKNEKELGAVELQHLVASSKRAEIYSCACPAWSDQSCVVRVVKEDDVGEELWSRMATDLYNAK